MSGFHNRCSDSTSEKQFSDRHRAAGSGSPCEFWRHRARYLWLLPFLLAGLCGFTAAKAQVPPATQTQITNLTAEMDQALQRVRQIVNQPVTRLIRQRGMQVSIFSPGWFHEGATKPNFNTVDIRTTQELIYAQSGYVSSDLNPGAVFIGQQLEFNSMTKYFYTDRSLPKKKLTEAEMVEINRLYRVIGRCEQQLDELQNPHPGGLGPDAESDQDSETTTTLVRVPVPRSRYIYCGLGILGVLVLYGAYRKWGR